ncbi:MAG TPA: hypothetical protein VHB79_28655 [Polyangiaceae bacterium]|nr:hypothetical protein [Polyangiaceae bacterium]
MKRILAALALLTVASLGAVGCGDDDDSSNNTGGTSSTGGEPSSENGGEAPSASGGQASGNVMCDPTVNGICQNETDCPFVVDGTARLTAGECGKGCVGKAETCSRDCILDMLKMSSDCASCYADTVNCTIKNCVTVCFADPEADVCKQCQVDKGCRKAFDECSGLPG